MSSKVNGKVDGWRNPMDVMAYAIPRDEYLRTHPEMAEWQETVDRTRARMAAEERYRQRMRGASGAKTRVAIGKQTKTCAIVDLRDAFDNREKQGE